MAKKVAADGVTPAVAKTLSARLITANTGDTLIILVEVENIAVPYTIAFDGRTVMYSLGNRQEAVQLGPGAHRLSWGFTHLQKAWQHRISVSVNAGAPTLLEERSEAQKDSPYSLGLAIVQAH